MRLENAYVTELPDAGVVDAAQPDEDLQDAAEQTIGNKGGGKFLTDSVADSPGLPNRPTAQSTFYQLKATTTQLPIVQDSRSFQD